jgi:hypothetical protein
MRTQRTTSEQLENTRIPVQAKLAALWASLMFLYVYVDILSLYQPGVIDGILDGRVWQLDITQTWAIGALALMAVPILMVTLSLTLPARANRTTNLTWPPSTPPSRSGMPSERPGPTSSSSRSDSRCRSSRSSSATRGRGPGHHHRPSRTHRPTG